MNYLDENGNEISEKEVDLTKGYLSVGYRIKPTAKPIDNKTKFVYEDSDFEEVSYYTLNKEKPTEEKIEELKSKLNATDYIAAKTLDELILNSITNEKNMFEIFTNMYKEYELQLKNRDSWRKEIRQLEKEITD